MRGALLVGLWVAVSGCGPEESQVKPEGRAQQAVVDLSTPSPWPSPFHLTLVPASAASAYLVAVDDPADSTRFVAWAFDVKTHTPLFFYSGTQRSKQDLLDQFGDSVTGRTFNPTWTYGITTAVGKKPPPAPSGGHDYSVTSAWASERADSLAGAP